MKYIRTKDGIIAFGEKYAYPTRLSNGKTYFSFKELTEDRFEVMKEYNHWDILKQADNIEELCDEFVHKENIKLPHIFVPRGHWTYEECKEWCSNEYSSKNDYGLYGAIWTDKGLIYVAKMNEKGELELI